MENRFQGKTLEEAYENASSSLQCSITDLKIEVIQSPTKGFLGLFSKKAVIEVELKYKKHHKKDIFKHKKQKIEVETLSSKLNQLNDKQQEKKSNLKQVKKEEIFNDFYNSKKETLHKNPVISKNQNELVIEIKKDINYLFSQMCYKIDEIEVALIDDGKTVYIEFNGEDSALLIGKEGYRYKALSYILFNWINEKYGLMLRLEIAEFLKNQEEAIYNYLKPVIETIKENGFYKTKTLDGILVHIALTKLREEFPDKYVAVKTNQRGDKYILVNEYKQNH